MITEMALDCGYGASSIRERIYARPLDPTQTGSNRYGILLFTSSSGSEGTLGGLVEAAQAMGCRRWHIVWHVLLPEALPGIVGGFTITLVTLINSSAMAGAIGAGGLGDIAYRYGYQRFDSQIMLTVIVMLVVLVALIQLGGDRLAKGLNKR